MDKGLIPDQQTRQYKGYCTRGKTEDPKILPSKKITTITAFSYQSKRQFCIMMFDLSLKVLLFLCFKPEILQQDCQDYTRFTRNMGKTHYIDCYVFSDGIFQDSTKLGLSTKGYIALLDKLNKQDEMKQPQLYNTEQKGTTSYLQQQLFLY